MQKGLQPGDSDSGGHILHKYRIGVGNLLNLN